MFRSWLYNVASYRIEEGKDRLYFLQFIKLRSQMRCCTVLVRILFRRQESDKCFWAPTPHMFSKSEKHILYCKSQGVLCQKIREIAIVLEWSRNFSINFAPWATPHPILSYAALLKATPHPFFHEPSNCDLFSLCFLVSSFSFSPAKQEGRGRGIDMVYSKVPTRGNMGWFKTLFLGFKILTNF